MTRKNELIAGLIVGATFGAIAGLLLAPNPGKVTRRMLIVRAGEVREKAGSYAGSLRRKMHEACGSEKVEESTNGHVEVTT